MKKIIIIISLLLSLSLMTSCASKESGSTPSQESENNQASQNTESSVEEKDETETYVNTFSLNEIDYTFYYPETESYTSSRTYGWSIGNGSEKIAVIVYAPASDYLEEKAADLEEAKDICSSYIIETIKVATQDYSGGEELPVSTKEIITTKNGIEMLKTVGKYTGEKFGELEYTAYYFLDEDKPVYVLAYPKDESGLKSSEPQFDYLVDQFVQHITKEG